MTQTLTTIEDAEAAWVEALLAPTTDLLRPLLHPQFVAVHGPVGAIQDAEEMLADTAGRPSPLRIDMLGATVRHFPNMATVSCIQEMRVAFLPEVPPFVIQAAVTRVWVREDGPWQLAHLQMARRLPPG